MNPEYILIATVIFLLILVSGLILCISYILNYQSNDAVQQSSYECGFQPYEDARQSFNIEFYLVGILFVIFDLEIVFIFPLCLCLKTIGVLGLYGAYSFLIILTAGFVYEWMKGALDW